MAHETSERLAKSAGKKSLAAEKRGPERLEFIGDFVDAGINFFNLLGLK